MADKAPEIVVETVAEVEAVHRQKIEVIFHADEQLIQLCYDSHYGELQFISFPAAKAGEICAAIMSMSELATRPKPAASGFPTGSFFVGNAWQVCMHCRKHHIPGTSCVDPRKPGDPQSLTHGIQAVKRWAKDHGNG
jgi:hypothetical protein